MKQPRQLNCPLPPLLMLLSFGLGLGAGCSDRQLPGEESELLPVCMLLPARRWKDGQASFVLDPDGSTARVCLCMSQEEWEMELRLDELHELGLEECLNLSDSYESNDCQQQYDMGEWLHVVGIAEGDNAHWATSKGLDCSQEDSDGLGCSVASSTSTSPRSHWLGLWALVLVGGLRWRRESPGP